MFNRLVSDILSEQTVLEEGIFSIPKPVFQDIIDYYAQMYEKFKVEKIKRITPDKFPPKTFEIDLTGTKFEFLNEMRPKVEIHFSSERSYFEPQFVGSFGKINLNMTDRYESMVYATIEHEILHFIQYLYVYNLYKKGKISRKQYIDSVNGDVPVNKTNYAGLPPKKLLDTRKNIHGQIITSGRRTKHAHRPIEYYPDLLSSIRELHFNFLKELKDKASEYDQLKVERPISKISSKQKEIDDIKTLEIQKKYFFKKFLSGDINSGIASWALSQFKSLSPEIEKLNKVKKKKKKNKTFNKNQKFSDGKRRITFYQHMIRLMYDGFMNRDKNFDEKYIHDNLKRIDDLYKEKNPPQEQKINTEEIDITFDRDYLKIASYDVSNIARYVSNETSDELDKIGSTIGNSQDLFLYKLNIKSRQNIYDEEIYVLPTNISSIKTLFKKIKQLSIEDIAKQYDVSDIAGEDIKKSLHKFLYKTYLDSVRYNRKDVINKFKEIIDSIYPLENNT